MTKQQKPSPKQMAYMMGAQMLLLFVFAAGYTQYIIKNPGNEVVAGIITFLVAVITISIVVVVIRRKTAEPNQQKA